MLINIKFKDVVYYLIITMYADMVFSFCVNIFYYFLNAKYYHNP